jgi:ribonuclease PH
MMKRSFDRQYNQTRPFTVEVGQNRYAEGSVLIKCGHTHVSVTATIEEEVPKWLKGKGTGWITAEYSMLPRATHTRSKREREKVSGRTQEIQRLIGRALRAMVDLKALGERQITVDCDVLQADGGTRTTSITGACIATTLALKKLIAQKQIPAETLLGTVAAISLGIKEGQILVDLDYDEDSSCDVDMNFVITGKGQLVEVQGTGERATFSLEQLNQMTNEAIKAVQQITQLQEKTL